MNNPHRAPEDGHPVDDLDVVEESQPMPFLQHLEDLRQSLWKASVAVAVGMAGGWWLPARA